MLLFQQVGNCQHSFVVHEIKQAVEMVEDGLQAAPLTRPLFNAWHLYRNDIHLKNLGKTYGRFLLCCVSDADQQCLFVGKQDVATFYVDLLGAGVLWHSET